MINVETGTGISQHSRMSNRSRDLKNRAASMSPNAQVM